MLAGLGQRLDSPRAFTPEVANYSAPHQSTTNTVEVTFDGLMVFEEVNKHDEVEKHYEVGVLGKEVADNHNFRIKVGKTELSEDTIKELQAAKTPLQLQVLTISGLIKQPNIRARDKKSCKRWQDTAATEDLEHVFDFCWIMDLEQEFHGNQALHLKPHQLRPIIWLNNGELYTKYKYDELQRQQAPTGTDFSDFGFVAETIALRVELQTGEHLILRGPKGIVFKLPTDAGERSAGFYNAPPESKKHRPKGKRQRYEKSHFLNYYLLSDDFGDQEKVDIKRKEVDPRRPLNRWYYDSKFHAFGDDIRIRTFDDQACGGIFLGKSKSGLGNP
jgi:hypothetical protein